MEKNIAWRLVTKEFNSLASMQLLDSYFKYFLTLKLGQLDIETIKNLLATLKMDKQCSELIIVLLILSTLGTTHASFSKFKNAYDLMKQAIASRAIYFCRPIQSISISFFPDFYHAHIMHFDPAKFENSKLLKIFIKNQQDFVYEIIFCLRSDFKPELLDLAEEQEDFKARYLNTDLARAIWSKNLEKVKELLKPIDINNACNQMGQPPLELATIIQADEIIEYLLDNNASYILENNFGRNALYYAASSKNRQCLKPYWHKIGERKSLFYFLKAAILTENSELLNIICKLLNTINSKTRFYNNLGELTDLNDIITTNLIYAVQKNRTFMLQKLLKFCKPGQIGIDWFLTHAIENNCFDTVQFLVPIVSPGWISNSLFPMLIARSGDLPKMKLVIDLGFNLELINPYNETAIMLAKKYGYEEIVALLEEGMHSNNISIEDENIVNESEQKFSTQTNSRKKKDTLYYCLINSISNFKYKLIHYYRTILK